MISETRDDMPPTWESLFHRAVELDPAARKRFLDSQCGRDAKLRRLLEELLEADASLSSTWSGLSAEQLEPAPPEIPDFENFEYLGQGGMGRVYRAFRKDRLFEGKSFAIKVLHSSHADPRAMARFESEKRLLASLDHPAIAGFYGGGTLPDGRPFLVMDYVEGRPLDVYCREERCTLEERLAMFTRLCGALQHAHQNLVIHRDLKPSNILIDSDGAPHLLDFGIAKRLEDQSTELTTTHHRPFTPAYASPEQTAGKSLTIASDLYSLGVVLFELLTDARPPAPDRDGKAPTSVLLSTRVDSEAASLRRTSLRQLTRQLKGDLQSIVRKAMHTDPQSRFGSAQELADDVDRHLTNQPVLAHRGNWRYQLRSLLLRHRSKLLSVCMGVFILGALAIWHTQRIAAVRNAVLALTGPSDEPFLISGSRERWFDLVLKLELPAEDQAALVDLIRRLYVPDDQLTLQIQEIFADNGSSLQQNRKAEIAFLFGEMMIKQSRFQDAESIIRTGIDIQTPDASESSLIKGYLLQAEALAELGRYSEGREQIQEVLKRTSGLDKSEALQKLADLFYLEGAFAESEAICRQGLRLLAQLEVEAPTHRSHFLKGLAVALSEQDPEDADGSAQAAAEEALALELEAFGPSHFATLQARNNLMMVFGRKGRVDEAMDIGLESLAIAEEVFGHQDPRLAYLLTGLARAQQLSGNPDQCIETARRALDLRERYLPPDSVLTAISKMRLADCLTEVGESPEAVTLVMSSISTFEKSGRKETKRLEAARAQLLGLLRYPNKSL